MTLPASGAMSLSMIAAELGIAATGLSLNDSRVRQLAGKPTGAISLADFYGKTVTPFTDYTISFSKDAGAGPTVVRCTSTGSFGSLTPGFSYRGIAIDNLYGSSSGFQLVFVGSSSFTQLTIGSEVLLRSAATFNAISGRESFSWPPNSIIGGPYAMRLEG